MPKIKPLSRNGQQWAYKVELEDLRRTNPKQPLLEIRAWFAVVETQIILFVRSTGAPYFIARILAAIVRLIFARIYCVFTCVVLLGRWMGRLNR